MKKRTSILRIIWLTLLTLLTSLIILESSIDSDTSKTHNDFATDLFKAIVDIFSPKKASEVERIEIISTTDVYASGYSFQVDVKVYPESAQNKSYSLSNWNPEPNYHLGIVNDRISIPEFEEESRTFTLRAESIDNPDVYALFEFTATQVAPTDFSIMNYYGADILADENILYRDIVANMKFIPDSLATLKDFEIECDENIRRISEYEYEPLNVTDDATITIKGERGFEKVFHFKKEEYSKSETPPDGINIRVDEYITYHRYGIRLYVDGNHKMFNFTAKSSNDGIFTVSENKELIMLSPGTATLTITTEDGAVVQKDITNSHIYGKPIITQADENNNITLYTNYRTFVVLEFPTDVTYSDYSLISSNSTLVTIKASQHRDYCYKSFIITPLKAGTCTLTLSADNGDETLESTYTLTIKSVAMKRSELNNFVRKALGHFLLFLFDGVFLMLFLSTFKMKYYKMAFMSLVSFPFAFITEVIQSFVPGRTGAIRDVLIDSSGFIIGFFIIFILILILRLIRKKMKNKKKKDDK